MGAVAIAKGELAHSTLMIDVGAGGDGGANSSNPSSGRCATEPQEKQVDREVGGLQTRTLRGDLPSERLSDTDGDDDNARHEIVKHSTSSCDDGEIMEGRRGWPRCWCPINRIVPSIIFETISYCVDFIFIRFPIEPAYCLG